MAWGHLWYLRSGAGLQIRFQRSLQSSQLPFYSGYDETYGAYQINAHLGSTLLGLFSCISLGIPGQFFAFISVCFQVVLIILGSIYWAACQSSSTFQVSFESYWATQKDEARQRQECPVVHSNTGSAALLKRFKSIFIINP